MPQRVRVAGWYGLKFQNGSHAHPHRVFPAPFPAVPFYDEAAFEVFAFQIDFVFAGDAFWWRFSKVRTIPSVYPYCPIGDALALAVRDAAIAKDRNVRPHPFP